jgi:hypothetical protein
LNLGKHGDLPSTSSEYLDRYHPKSSGTKYDRYVAKETKSILDKVKSQKVGKLSMGQVAKKQRERRERERRYCREQGRNMGMEFSADPRREDLLQRELRNLFCEE